MSDELGSILRRYTPARVGLGQVGSAVPTREQLRFQLDHALARDAVHARMDVEALLLGLRERGMAGVALRSAVGEERRVYLRRPDLGRRLDGESAVRLREVAAGLGASPEVVFVMADGLSALAVERHGLAVIDAVKGLMEGVWPVCVVSQGRVAVGDELGELLGAKAVVMLIGERPGLSAADSLGAYVTWEPQVGRTDAERNCVSNIRVEGLGYAEAAERIVFYLNGAKRLGASGVGLKEASGWSLPGL
jgi:ethanolamine ammonia-lyase small subunit